MVQPLLAQALPYEAETSLWPFGRGRALQSTETGDDCAHTTWMKVRQLSTRVPACQPCCTEAARTHRESNELSQKPRHTDHLLGYRRVLGCLLPHLGSAPCR